MYLIQNGNELNMKNRIFLFLLVSLVAVGCTDTQKRFKVSVIQLTSQPISIPYDKLCKIGNDSIYDQMEGFYRLIVFTDSLSCASCALKHLVDWEPFLDSLKTTDSRIVPTFIFDPPRESRHTFERQVKSEVNIPVYIDTCHSFIKQNPHIPDLRPLQVFLINDRDSVVLVGNPLTNEKIKMMLFDILKSK